MAFEGNNLVREVGVGVELLRRVYEGWNSYPDNMKTYTLERVKLVEQFKQHFDETKETVLLQVPKSKARRRQVFKSTKVVFHDCGINDRSLVHIPTPNDLTHGPGNAPPPLPTASTMGSVRSGTTLAEDITNEPQQDNLTRTVSEPGNLDEIFGLTSPGHGQPRADPVCRFIFIDTTGLSSRKLGITEEILLKILTYHRVSPVFLNYISYFSNNFLTSDCDLFFAGFRSVRSFSQPTFNLDALGRSGFYYQLAFQLKTVFIPRYEGEESDGSVQPDNAMVMNDNETNTGKWAFLWRRRRDVPKDNATEIFNPELEKLQTWRLEPTAFHHHFDVVNGKSLWIIPGFQPEGSATDASRVEKMIFPCDISSSSSFKERLEATLMVLAWLGEWSLSDFGVYINAINKNIQTLTKPYFIDVPVAKVSSNEVSVFKILNQHMEFIDGCIVALEANLGVCKSVLHFYKTQLLNDARLRGLQLEWVKESSKARLQIEDAINTFADNMQNTCDAISDTLRRVAALKQIGTRRDSIVQRLLQNRNEGIMRDLAQVTHKDSTTMIIFSTITLILLPVSVVSTIFSAGIVQFDSDTAGFAGKWSGPAAVWWAAATILATTAVTVASNTWRQNAVDKTKARDRLREAGFSPGSPPSWTRIYVLKAYHNMKKTAQNLYHSRHTSRRRRRRHSDADSDSNSSTSSRDQPWTGWLKAAVYDRVKGFVWKPASPSPSGSSTFPGEMHIHYSPPPSRTGLGGRWQDDLPGNQEAPVMPEGHQQQPADRDDDNNGITEAPQRDFDEVNNMERGQARAEEQNE
ncbi:hypothetical protein B0T24DRAFT_368154 [Lasiosphaeria ovina]|uniref:CorA-like transporter domain-containing protein n=1 Tax=Lasiosphaeria ovina TaxID=92902 RepID=A0AAE0JYL5_9PEZI|nr:hypothetical protein B0T24DRAFT_368154 [Lasiosphaeria ovina]